MITKFLEKIFLTSCLLAPLAQVSFAQPATLYQMTHEYDGYDLKSYSVTEQTDFGGLSNLPRMLKAGTFYNPDPLNADSEMIHFVHLREDGATLYSKIYESPGYLQTRAVRILGNGGLGTAGNATYYIVGQVRPFNGADDQILVHQIDYQGNTVGNGSYIQASQTPNIGSLYPLDAVYNSNNGYIYICGYWTPHSELTQFPNSPGFSNTKMGFVICFDPVTRSVIANQMFGHTITPAPPIGGTDDFDIAMRIEVDANNNIHCTGSTNAARQVGSGTVFSLSATMNISFDPATLAVINDKPFIQAYADGAYQNEYGIGFVHAASTTGNNYIIGNKFYRNLGNSMGGMPTGFDVQPNAPWVTLLDPTFAPYSTACRYAYTDGSEYVWGLQAMESASNAPLTDHIRIVGQQVYEKCNTTNPYAANISNVVPFILDIDASYPGANLSSSSVNPWKVYENQTGTGTNTLSNSYENLGCNLDIMGWNCPNATTTFMGSPPSVLLTAPKWNGFQPAPAANQNFKSLRVDWASLKTVTGCHPVDEENKPLCSVSFSGENVSTNLTVTGYSFSNDRANINVTIGNHPINDYDLTETSDLTCPGHGYKATSIDQLHKNLDATEIYPNPAAQEINVLLSDKIQADLDVEIDLLNIYGQVVAHLYKGKAADLSHSLQLPETTAGLYTVQVHANDGQVSSHKLIINAH